MKKSWQRLGSAFLAFLMVFTMLPASVLADSGTAAGDSLNVSGTPAVRSVINPGTDSSSYQTYRFYVEGTLVDTQVVKTGDTRCMLRQLLPRKGINSLDGARARAAAPILPLSACRQCPPTAR